MASLLEIFKNRNQIWEGMKNNIFKKEHIEEVYRERLIVCESCSLYDIDGRGCAVPGTRTML